jgi:hypothetical protein
MMILVIVGIIVILAVPSAMLITNYITDFMILGFNRYWTVTEGINPSLVKTKYGSMTTKKAAIKNYMVNRIRYLNTMLDWGRSWIEAGNSRILTENIRIGNEQLKWAKRQLQDLETEKERKRARYDLVCITK